MDINAFFANLYEAVLRHPQFSTRVFDGHDYIWLGVFLFIVPLILAMIFYKVWDPTPVKKTKWFVMLLFPTIIIVFGLSAYWLYSGSLQGLIINLEPGISKYLLTLALYNSIFSIIVVAIYSFVLKRLSINNINNPV